MASRFFLDGVKNIGLFSLLRPLARLFPVRAVRFKTSLKNGSLSLSLFSLKDLPALYPLFKPEIFLIASQAEPGNFRSLISFLRWMRRAFEVCYVIRDEQDGKDRIIGFIGFYNTKIGRSLYLTAVLFDPRDRGQGYGRQALGLLMNFLMQGRIVRKVYAEVLRANTHSLNFFKDLGFGLCEQKGDRLLLERRMKEMQAPSSREMAPRESNSE
jgi:RimJ/RimL family protein N-acetyltransferase